MVVKLRMLSVLILTTFLNLPPASVAAPSLVFTPASPGLAQLNDIGVDGDLTVSFKFRTGASEAQLLHMRELSTDHFISLSIKNGGLHLQVNPGTAIGPLTEDSGEMARVDDQQWHDVYLSLNGGQFKYIVFKLDDINKLTVSELPLLSDAEYQTWLGGLPPSLDDESEAPYVGCIRDIRVLDTDRDLEDLQLTGVTVEECGLTSLDLSSPVFQGPLLGVISETDQVGSFVMNIQAVTGDTTRQIQYELIENPQGYFALDRTTGSLTIARQLDRVALAAPRNVLTLTIRASVDEGSNSTIAEVTIVLPQEADTTGPLSEQNANTECFCGQKKSFIEESIVGGEFAKVNEFPWVALLNLSSSENGRTSRCGGSLISDRHIITAAHCLQENKLNGDIEFEYDDITIILGI